MSEHKFKKYFDDDNSSSDTVYFAMFAYDSTDTTTWNMESVPKDDKGFEEKMAGWEFFDKTGKIPRFVPSV